MTTHSTTSPLRFFLFFTSLLASVFMAGCGGGSNKTDPAPSSLNGRTITITDDILDPASTTYTYSGSVSGTFTSTLSSGGSGDSGTFVYTKTVGTTNKAVLQMTGVSGVGTTITYNLTFMSPAGGNYTDNLGNDNAFRIN